MGTPPIQFPADSTGERPFEPQPRATPEPHAAPDPDNPPWGLLEALGLLVWSFVLMIVTSLAFLIPYVVYHKVQLTAFAEFAVKDPGAIFVQIVSIIPAHLLTLASAWFIVTRNGKYPFFKTLGWEWSHGFNFWWSTLLAVVLLGVGLGIVWLTGPTDNALERLIQSSRAAALATAFAASITAPLVEELVFRGVLYSALRRMVGAGGAVAVVLFVFALIHVPQYWPSYGVILTILLLSVVLTLIRAYTGQLLPCFIVHFVFNSIQAVLIVLNPYLERLAPEAPVPAPVPAPGLIVELFARLLGG